MVAFSSSHFLIALFIILPLLTNGRDIARSSSEIKSADDKVTVAEQKPTTRGRLYSTHSSGEILPDASGNEKQPKIIGEKNMNENELKVVEHKETTLSGSEKPKVDEATPKSSNDAPLDRMGRLVVTEEKSTDKPKIDDMLEKGTKVKAAAVPVSESVETTMLPPTTSKPETKPTMAPSDKTTTAEAPVTLKEDKEPIKPVVVTDKAPSDGTASSSTIGIIHDDPTTTIESENVPTSKSSTPVKIVPDGAVTTTTIGDKLSSKTPTIGDKLSSKTPDDLLDGSNNQPSTIEPTQHADSSATSQGISMIVFALISFYLI